LNKFKTIAKGGRVSNPVPGSSGMKAEIASEIAEARRIWSAELMLDAVVLELVLDFPLSAM